MHHLLRQFFRNRRGAAGVEFALILPLLAMLIVSSIWLGQQINSKMVLQDAVHAGMYYAMLNPDKSSDEIKAVVEYSLGSVDADITAEEYCMCYTTKQVCTASCGTKQKRYISVHAKEKDSASSIGEDFDFQAGFQFYAGEK